MQFSACSHLNNALQRPGAEGLHCWYKAVCQRMVFPSTQKYAIVTATYLHCSLCPEEKRLKCQVLLMCCTDCNTFMCLNHMPSHLRDRKHSLAMSLETGHIYCLRCADFVYSQCIEHLRMNYLNAYRVRLGLVKMDMTLTNEDLSNWKRSLLSSRPQEVRGLFNMGNTCYMNCVVQALVHTPLLRRVLVGNHYPCLMTKGECFHCELIRLVEKMNSSEEGALASPQLLCLLWRLAPHLAGYRQHDAQEFFLAAHDLMHRHYQGPSQKMAEACHCIMHTAFGGVLISTGSCGDCRHKWISGEGSFVDVQLNVPENARKSSTHLRDCLQDFCRDETISDYSCPRCHVKPTVRQTKFRRLPAVLVLHLKRFKLSPTGVADSTKVSTDIHYDHSLDMTDFIASQRINDGSLSKATLHRLNNSYSLFAIVSHSGSMQVTSVDPVTVTKAEAYMLFYQNNSIR